jgi:uncharacterized protein YdiU (UPF0061 family)
MTVDSANPFLSLPYEPAIAALGNDYSDEVTAAEFAQHLLRFRNDALLPHLGLDPQSVKDADFIEVFGKFRAKHPFLALRYHGYQFGEYNPHLGDGRGFLYGQVRGVDGYLYDLGTKGSGQTPYSRNGDGRLTLKGGVREVIAAEALQQLGVTTSRCLSLIETGEALWRGDEPSPTRSSVMIRLSRSHIRFGTFERLHYHQRPDLIEKLLDHVIEVYYPHLTTTDGAKALVIQDRYARFYAELVERVAELAAQWMVAGFCHGVLNTDNMSITGESFDYGPYAFIPNFDLRFTAAYFDYSGLYSYGNQPYICRLNLERLQAPLSLVIAQTDLDAGLAPYIDHYRHAYARRLLQRMGWSGELTPLAWELVQATLELFQETQLDYPRFWRALTEQFNAGWWQDPQLILENSDLPKGNWTQWRELYYRLLLDCPLETRQGMGDRLRLHNPPTVPTRPLIESIWEPIAYHDNWQPFNELVQKLQTRT